jgi:hypothetical protein
VTAGFSLEDIGKKICIEAAGEDGAPLITTINRIFEDAPDRVELNDPAFTTIPNAIVRRPAVSWGTDNAGAIAGAREGAALVFFPPGTYLVGSDITLDVAVEFAPGARLLPCTVVTIAGPILAGPLQTIFDCTHNVFGVRSTTATTVNGGREITVGDPTGIAASQRIWVLTAGTRRGDLKTRVSGVAGNQVTLRNELGDPLPSGDFDNVPIIHESSVPRSWVVMDSRFSITSKQQVSPVWFTGTASTTGTSRSRLNKLIVASTAGLYRGKQIMIAGAGPDGALLTTSITRLGAPDEMAIELYGSQAGILTLAASTETAVDNATVTFTDFGAQWNNMQAAINWGESGPMSVRIAGRHVYTVPIDMTNIRMGGEKLSLHCEDAFLIAQTSGQPAIDLMNARGIRFYNLNLRGDTDESVQTINSPNIGILMGSDIGEHHSGHMEFYSAMVTGFFSLAAVYANESEVNVMFGGRYGNDHSTGKYILWVGDKNDRRIDGPYRGALGETQSATTWHLYGVTINGDGASEGLLYNAGFDRLIIHGGAFKTERGYPVIVIDTSRASQAGFHCLDTHFEVPLADAPAMRLKGHFNHQIANLYFRPLWFRPLGVIVEVASRLHLNDCIFEGITGALRFNRGSVLEECQIDMRGGASAEGRPESLILGEKFTGRIAMRTIGSFTTTGCIEAASSSLTVTDASKIVEGQAITVAGAGASGSDLVTAVTSKNGPIVELGGRGDIVVTRGYITMGENTLTVDDTSGFARGDYVHIARAGLRGAALVAKVKSIQTELSQLILVDDEDRDIEAATTIPSEPPEMRALVNSALRHNSNNAGGFLPTEMITVVGAGPEGTDFTTSVWHGYSGGRQIVLEAFAHSTVLNAPIKRSAKVTVNRAKVTVDNLTPAVTMQAEIHDKSTTDLIIKGARLKVDPEATAGLPEAGALQDGTILIEDAGSECNLVLYKGGQRFRFSGGMPF